MIPFYACQAHGGKLLTLDDEGAITGLADSGGAGGTTFQPKFRSSRFSLPPGSSFWRLRRLAMYVAHASTATIVTQLVRDGMLDTASVTRNIAASDVPPLVVPLAGGGSSFQVEVTVTAFAGAVQFGESMLFPVARRSQR